MSTVTDQASRASTAPAEGRPAPAVACGAFAAVQAAAASLVVVLVPVVLAWVTSTRSGGWLPATRIGLDAWLLSQHAGLIIPGGHIGLVPMGLLPVPALACWFAGRRLARTMDPKAAAIAAGVSLARPARVPMRAITAFVLCYAGLGAAVSMLAAAPEARPVLTQAVLGTLVVAGVAGAAGAAAYRAGGARAGAVLLVDGLGIPEPVRRWCRLGGVAILVLAGAAVVLTAVAVVARLPRVLALHQALTPGLAGGSVLVALELALLPDLMVWSGAFVIGPGFALGVGTSVSPRGTVLGSLPAVPLLGAVPRPGAQPGWMTLVVLVPVLAGVVAGVVAARRRPDAALTALGLDGLGAALAAGVGFLLLAWLASGPAGPGRLGVTGPVPWLAGGVLAGEVLIGALAGTAATRALGWLWGGRSRHRAPARG